MSRYIDRDFLERRIHETMDMQDLYLPIHFIQLMNEQDASDAVEVKHGHWAHDFGGYVECSNCDALPLLDGERGYVESEYCPWCGAKMDEVTE